MLVTEVMGYLSRRRALLVVVSLVAVSACGGDGGEAAADVADQLAFYEEEGVVLGIADEEPYGYEEHGEATGAAPELAREVFSRLGIEVRTYMVTDFRFLVDGLVARRMDVVSAGMYINEERARRVLFADADYCAPTAFAVPEGNPDGLVNYPSVVDAEVTLGVVVGTVEQVAARRHGVENVEEYPANDDAFEALENDEVDAVALTTFTVVNETDQMEGFEATDGFVPEIEGDPQRGCGGFGFRYEDEALRNAFNDELAAMQDAGEVLPIVEPFGFDDVAVDAALEVTAHDLVTDGL